jgi:hypothetical protein
MYKEYKNIELNNLYKVIASYATKGHNLRVAYTTKKDHTRHLSIISKE